MGSLKATLTALTLIAATPAFSQVQLLLQDDKKEGAEPMPVHAWIGLTQSIGSGTFVISPFNPTTSTNLSVTPFISYKGWMILASQSFGMEWTQSDGTTYANQMEMSDTSLAVRQMSWLKFKEAGISIWPAMGITLPISLTSRQAGSLGGLTGGVRVNYGGLSDYGISLFGGLNGGYNLLVPSLANSFAGNDVKPLTDRVTGGVVNTVGCNVRNAQELDNYACSDGGLPSVARWGASVGVGWFQLFDGALGFSANLGYSQSFSLKTGPDDEFTADSAVAGLVPRQATGADITATYTPIDWLNLSAGFGSSQPFLTSDGKGMRFPFWDFVSPYNNFSAIHLDATLSL